MMYPLVLDLAAESIPVTVTCRVLGFSKQAFYAWCKSPVTQRDWDEAHLINAAIDIHHDDPEFGYRFIADELAGQGVVASRNRLNRLCTLQRLWSAHSRKRSLNRKPGPPVHDDLLPGRVNESLGRTAPSGRNVAADCDAGVDFSLSRFEGLVPSNHF
jgi:putative transposase